MGIEARLQNLESSTSGCLDVGQLRRTQINLAELALSATEQLLGNGNALSSDPASEEAERAALLEEREELTQEIADLRAGKYDQEIADELRKPPITGDERAAKGLECLRAGIDEHERKIQNFTQRKDVTHE